MRIGITGNTSKDELWDPVASLIDWLETDAVAYCLHQDIADGLAARDLVDASLCQQHTEPDLADASDVILSFGGDGTLLNSAHEVGARGTPLLGINIGRLGFLADVEVGQVREAIRHLDQGTYSIEPRLVLTTEFDVDGTRRHVWALNEFVIARGGPVSLINIDVTVDGTPLNTYWADGLIMATPTGSTAYSLAVNGPIVMPGSDVVILSPLAPHSLTVRPFVLSADAVIEARVDGKDQPCVLAADGKSILLNDVQSSLTMRRAEHRVNLVKLPGQHYFQTLRSKLMWGVRNHRR
ncbi:MAG: ATP-NAD kinase [Bacteroidetes bacterium]|jgi:NAD+ kinase|nr:ATP-NAD kinase [Bacteroidota bacterium]